MEITIDFPGGARVDAHFRGHDLPTDQPVKDGGEDSAPMPFDLFLVSIATCVGYYVLKFCQQRDLPTDSMRTSPISNTARAIRASLHRTQDGVPIRSVSRMVSTVGSDQAPSQGSSRQLTSLSIQTSRSIAVRKERN